LSISLALPFEDSRRLTGPNLFFAATGAVLEVTVAVLAGESAAVLAESLLADWRARITLARQHLGWPHGDSIVRRHPLGASLAVPAPCDQLFVATEINEWALCSSLVERDPERWRGVEEALRLAALENADDPQSVIPPVLEQSAAFVRFTDLSRRERRPKLHPLIQAAVSRDLPYTLDDTLLTLGEGRGGVDFALEDLPPPPQIPWEKVHAIPTALVTGSNGKTTTVRLLAACSRLHGWHAAYSSTDGVFFDGEVVDAGDYSGPAGARLAIRDRRAQAAILETARGGILRRGLAVSRADVALVTNVSSDHFGEYGITDLGALADVKLTVGVILPPGGLLVLNADDALLRAKADTLSQRFGLEPSVGWFSLNADSEFLRDHRARGGATSGLENGRLCVSYLGVDHDLGAISSMPLTVEGSAVYNIANLAGAALAAVALGIPPSVVASVFAQFGAKASDNLGRLMRFDIDSVKVILDYAHNAEGLRGLLNVAQHLRDGGTGRLGLLLGHAGNRRDTEIQELARIAAEFHPDLVVVKENEAHLRGREQGEVPRIIRTALLRVGMPESALPLRMTEVDAAQCALDWARPGDVLALLVHSSAARAAVLSMLEARAAQPSSR
jgi:UDP-N-acetylmuramyl tripeptide synthase